MTKYACNNCGAKVKTGEIVGKLGAGFRLEHIECPQCGQHTLSAGERMSVQEAAGIIRRAANERDGKAASEGLNSVKWVSRRVGSILTTRVEELADNVLKGHRVTAAEANALKRIAKRLKEV